MKTLISWIATNNDFEEIEGVKTVNVDGPTYSFHKYFFTGYDRHIVLSSKSSDDIRLISLTNKLKVDFPDHNIEADSLPVSDVIDIDEIKRKVEEYLINASFDEIDVFISPGTPAMQIAWFIVHMTADLKTRLLQTRPSRFTKSGIPELIVIQTERSAVPITAILNQKWLNDHSKNEKYKITGSIQPIYDLASKIAETDSVTALILGETGTGKEHLAKFIHDFRRRFGTLPSAGIKHCH